MAAVDEDADEEAKARERERRRAHRKLKPDDRAFRAAVAMLIGFWDAMSPNDRRTALATIEYRARAKGADEVSRVATALATGPDDWLRPLPFPASCGHSAGERLTMPLGYVADWAFDEAFGR